MKKVDKKSISNHSSIQNDFSTNIRINIPRLTLDINGGKRKESID